MQLLVKSVNGNNIVIVNKPKVKRKKLNNLPSHLKRLEKHKTKPKASRRKAISDSRYFKKKSRD